MHEHELHFAVKLPPVIVALCLAVAGTACNCDTRVFDTRPSPDGGLVAFVYARECGATVAENRHVALLRAGQVPGDEIANVASFDGGHDASVKLDVRIDWRSSGELEVHMDGRARAFRRAMQVGAVKVRYLPLE